MFRAFRRRITGQRQIDVRGDDVDQQLQQRCVNFALLIRECRVLVDLKRVHEHLIRIGKSQDAHLLHLLIQKYGKCGSVNDAKATFDALPRRNVYSWTLMMAAFMQNGFSRKALKLYHNMDVEPDAYVFVAALTACSELGILAEGKAIQKRAEASSQINLVVENALVNMYAKCGSLKAARKTFDKIQQKDVISWSAMIAGYAQNGHPLDAINLFHQMDLHGVKPTYATFATVVAACSTVEALEKGKTLHSRILASGIQPTVVVETALVDMYAKCGMLDIASNVFERMHKRNVVSWNAMITGYAQNGAFHDVIELYEKMDVQPDGTTFAGVLCACGNLGALECGKKVHAHLRDIDCKVDLVLQNALVMMYGKCGCTLNARYVFDSMQYRDIVSWTGIIAAYAQEGYGGEILQLHHMLHLDGVEPDSIIYVSILIACNHSGLLNEARECLVSMVEDHGIVPSGEHYVCMVGLIARSGRLGQAEELISNMPYEPDCLPWLMLLAACRVHSDPIRGMHAAELAMDLDPHHTSPYVLLSNLYQQAL